MSATGTHGNGQDHGQFVGARFTGFVTKSCLQKLDVSGLMRGDLLEPPV